MNSICHRAARRTDAPMNTRKPTIKRGMDADVMLSQTSLQSNPRARNQHSPTLMPIPIRILPYFMACFFKSDMSWTQGAALQEKAPPSPYFESMRPALPVPYHIWTRNCPHIRSIRP